MIQELTDRFAGFVTTHNRLVVVLLLVLTAGVAFGMTTDQGGADQSIDDDAMGDSDVFEAAEYIDERYGDDEPGENVTTADAYVLGEDGSALERESLLTGLKYQQAALEDPTVADALVDDGVGGMPNLVAAQLTGPDAGLDAQYEAVESADDDELEAAVAAAVADGETAAFYLPTSYEAGSTESEAYRMTFAFDLDEASDEAIPHFDAQESLYETAGEYDSPTVFVDGQPAWAELNDQFLADSAWLVIPAILLVLLVILGFAYRDLTDVLVGFTGTLFALVWAAGLMGWMGLLNQQTAIIAPVLVAALSIDFGFHVFMRYRERRGPGDGIRAAMRRSTGAVTVAFLLVTVTAAVGFLSNQTSPVGVIRELGVAITLGVVGALVIFTTLVPALKVSADGLWERFGFDRRKTALGKGRYLSRVLSGGVVLARRGALVVVAVALVGGLVGGLAFADLDREAFQQPDFSEVPEWKTELPGPMAFEAHESDAARNLEYVGSQFQADQDSVTDGGAGFTAMLVQGDDGGVATPEAMAAIAAGHDAAAEADSGVVIQQNDHVGVVSPLSLMEEVAAGDEEFAAALAAADTTDDGVPDSDIEALYDALFEAAPDEAAEVLERTDDGYESALVLVPAQGGYDSERAGVMHGIADEMASEAGGDVTAVGVATFSDAEMGQIADGIVVTLLLAMGGVLVTLAVVYRLVHGSATLGVVTVVPIALALGLVFGGMSLAGQPLTMLTALLVSITVGLGIDYNIHLSDRFAGELERGHDVTTALREAVTGTGGALLGSAVTSGGAFSLLVLIPHPQMVSFGFIVALALGVSFLLSVFVLPSLLWLWTRRGRAVPAAVSSADALTGD